MSYAQQPMHQVKRLNAKYRWIIKNLINNQYKLKLLNLNNQMNWKQKKLVRQENLTEVDLGLKKWLKPLNQIQQKLKALVFINNKMLMEPTALLRAVIQRTLREQNKRKWLI